MKKIDEDFLRDQGFKGSGEKHINRIIWRRPLKGSGFLNFTMGNYPENNPNVGVLGIYFPKEFISSVPKDLLNKEEWTKDDYKRARDYKVEIGQSLVNIAFYLDDQERFKRLVDDLTFERE